MRRFAPVWAVVALFCALPVAAQDIDDLDEGVVLEQPFELGIEPNKWEASLYFGTADYNTVLLRSPGIVVDVEDPKDALFADSELSGQSSFTPQLRIGRTFGRRLALEASFGFAIGDFEQTATNFVSWSDPFSRNTLTEVEREKGSYFVYTQELAAIYYPRGKGRMQPYLIAGAGQNFWQLDTNYVDGTPGSFVYSFGAGLRIVGDDLYSFRLEARRYSTKVNYEVSTIFATIPSIDARSLVDFPVSRLQTVGEAGLTEEQILAIFDSLKLNPDDFVNTQGEFPPELLLPLPFPKHDEQTFDTIVLSAGFTAAF
jgi:hypothetical protein